MRRMDSLSESEKNRETYKGPGPQSNIDFFLTLLAWPSSLTILTRTDLS